MQKVILFPGLGVDGRVFKRLTFPPDCQTEIIEWEKEQLITNPDIVAYAKSILPKIETPSETILIGHSMGGMICTELAHMANFKMVILLSSAKLRSEVPWRYRILDTLPLHRLYPNSLFSLVWRTYPYGLVMKYSKDATMYTTMIKDAGWPLIKAQIDAVASWQRKMVTQNLIEISGTGDLVLPVKLKSNKPVHLIKGGGHKMILNRAEEVSEILSNYVVA